MDARAEIGLLVLFVNGNEYDFNFLTMLENALTSSFCSRRNVNLHRYVSISSVVYEQQSFMFQIQ